jgi:RNA polymerase sigma-70 factor (ECF subfamily)
VYFMQHSDDEALVSRARAGDTGAFETLVTRYHRVLFTVALRMLGNDADAGDATQVAFIRAYERLDSFDPRFRFFSWLYRILLNECSNSRRGRRAPQEIASELAADPTPLEALERAERRRRVQMALLDLPAEYRQVVVLRHFGELSYEEIAGTLGISSKTVKSRLYTARQRLLAQLVGETI